MTAATINAYERLWQLHDHADLQMYGPDLLIQDVQTILAEVAHLHGDLGIALAALFQAETQLAQLREVYDDLQRRIVREWEAER